MFVQKVPHIKDQFLTQERASMELESGQIAVGWYTNEQDSQSVVHSHPYYELVLPLVGSNVRYSVDGNIYDINLGEMIIFPARCYHAGMFNITDKISIPNFIFIFTCPKTLYLCGFSPFSIFLLHPFYTLFSTVGVAASNC